MKTTDYSKFKFNDLSRPILKSNVENIINSIQKIGFIEQRSIFILNDFTIIDGHHRFIACKELQIPIYYEFIDDSNSSSMILLNKCQKVWSLENYIQYYAKKGIFCYELLLDIQQKYKIGISNSIAVLFNSGASTSKKIRKGEDVILNESYKEAIDFILFSKSQIPYWKSKCFVEAVTIFIKRSRTDLKNIEKIKDNLSSIR